MADWVVLSDYSDGSLSLKAGTRVSDAEYPNLATLVTGGLAVVGYTGGMDPVLAAFDSQRARGAPVDPPSLLAALIAAGIVPGVSGVATTRNLIAGTGLTGGGTLAADRTFDVVANADGSIIANANDVQVGILATDAQHGVRGGGTQHANAIAAGAAGFMTGADKTKLDGVGAGATVASITPTAPITVGGTAAVPVVGIDAATGALPGSMSAADKAKSDAAHGTGAGVAKAFADTGYVVGADVSGVEVDTSGGIVEIVLPALATVPGTKVAIADALSNFATNKCTLTPDGVEKINGAAAPFDLTVDDTKIVLWAGPTSWWVIGL